MSTALKEIKNRIKAANNIKQIAKAMKLIASIKVKKIQKAFFPFKSYLSSVEEILNVLINNIDFKLSIQNLELLNERKTNKRLVIVISSDKGLCGAFNSNLFNFFEKKVSRETEYFKEMLLVTIGKKATIYFSKRNYNIIESINKVPDIPYFSFSKNITELIINKFHEDKSIASVEVLYNKFINSLVYEPSIVKVVPLSLNLSKKELNSNHFIFEPNVENIGNYVLELYLYSLVYKLLVESKLSEFSARFRAMNIASDNADNLIKELKLLFFKKRQESITKELLEISAGVEALKI